MEKNGNFPKNQFLEFLKTLFHFNFERSYLNLKTEIFIAWGYFTITGHTPLYFSKKSWNFAYFSAVGDDGWGEVRGDEWSDPVSHDSIPTNLKMRQIDTRFDSP